MPAHSFRFGPYELDPTVGDLRKHGVRLKLQKQPFQILTLLVARPHEVVTREELQNRIWSNGTFVDFDHGLNTAVNKLRQALADSPERPRFIETVPGRGYRFIAALEIAENTPPLCPQPVLQVRAKPRHWIWILSATVFSVGLICGLLLTLQNPPPNLPAPVQFTVPAPEELLFEAGYSRQDFALSPDGTRLAFIATNFAESQLWIRELSSLKMYRLTSERKVRSVAWSPDSRFLYFDDLSSVRRISASGGSSESICALPSGPSWNSFVDSGRELLLFTRAGTAYAVPHSGGTPMLQPGDLQYLWPQSLPDGHLLHISFDTHIQSHRAWVSKLDNPRQKERLMQTDSRVVYSPLVNGGKTGHLLYVRAGTLVAQAIDASTLRLSRQPSPIAQQVFWFAPTAAAAFSASANGVLAYRPLHLPLQLKWVDRVGRDIEVIGKPESFLTPFRLSPDRTRLAASIYDVKKGGTDIWVYDLEHHAEARLTRGVGHAASPTWAPDGNRLTFIHVIGASPRLRWTRLDGGDGDHAFEVPGPFHVPTDWSPDGRFIAYQTSGGVAEPGTDVLLLDLAHGAKPVPLLQSTDQEFAAVFSPDTSLIAFLSNETGRPEVYAQEFQAEPQPHLCGDRRRISNDGATLARWRPDGKELFYINSDNYLMAVEVHPNIGLNFAPPRRLFHLETTPRYLTGAAMETGFDVSADGTRFLVADARPLRNPPFIVVENWQSLLNQ